MAEDLPNEFVVGLLLDPGKQLVILIRKEKPAWQRGRWNGPGGHVKEDETPLAAMIREYEEETGVAIASWQYLARYRTDTGALVHFFTAAHELFWKVTTQTPEVVQGFPIARLPHETLPNIRWLVQMAAYESGHCWPYTINEHEH